MTWESVPLGRLIAPAPPSRLGTDRQLPVLSMTMRDGLIDQSVKFKKRIAGEDLSGYRVVKRGQLVVGFPIDEAVLAFQWLHDAGIVSPAYGLWDVSDEGRVDRKYLERFLRSDRAISFYKAKLRGTTLRRRSLPRAVFEAMPVPVPPLSEQRRIATILDEADTLRLEARKSAALVSELADSMFSAAMLRAGTVAPISASVVLITGPFGSSVHKSDYQLGGIPLVNPSHIRNGRIEIDSKVAVSVEKARQLSQFALREGDVVLGRRGEMGRAAVVERTNTPALCGTGTMILRPTGGLQVGAYIARLLRTSRYVDLLTNAASGVTMLNLSQSAVGSITVPSPTPELLNLVDEIDAISRARVDAAEARSAGLDALFASLQHRAFRGEL